MSLVRWANIQLLAYICRTAPSCLLLSSAFFFSLQSSIANAFGEIGFSSGLINTHEKVQSLRFRCLGFEHALDLSKLPCLLCFSHTASEVSMRKADLVVSAADVIACWQWRHSQVATQ